MTFETEPLPMGRHEPAPGASAIGTGVSKRRRALTPYLWILPAALMLAFLFFYPIVFNVALSFFDWNGFDRDPFAKFIALGNYATAFTDPYFLIALRNTALFVLFTISLQNALALFAAIFLYLGRFRASGVLRAIIFFPGVLSAVVVALTWRNIVLLRGGLINQITAALRLPDFFPLSNPDIAFYAIIVISIWQWIGFNFVIFYAGLQSLDEDLLDAAQVDGAAFWQLTFRIIIPQQWQVVLTNVVLNLIGGFQVFDIVFVLTRGGPVHSSESLANYMVLKSFSVGQSHMGYAAAIATLMMLLTMAFAGFRARAARALG